VHLGADSASQERSHKRIAVSRADAVEVMQRRPRQRQAVALEATVVRIANLAAHGKPCIKVPQLHAQYGRLQLIHA
jgi:hypothetical protein